MDKFYQKVDAAQDQDAIEGLIDEIRKSDKNNPLCNFDINKVPENVPINEKFAYLARKVALEIHSKREGEWQHYWFRCCISSKCNYIFKVLDSKKVNREEDLIEICNPQSSLYKSITNERIRQSYFDLSIDFLLRRYNLCEAFQLCLKAPNKYRNLPKFIIPRMTSAILVGFIVIATSSEIWEFTVTNQPYLISYCTLLLSLSVLYLLMEYCKTTQSTLLSLKSFRILPILIEGISFSVIFSYIFTIIGLFTTVNIPETAISCTSRIIFYSVLAFLIGILIQLFWEEKAMTEPF